jgi:NAD(P)-dependent dehydrogenase (short-subunit alcohol dehydrogenase family)
MMNLVGRTAIVTGAARGLGRTYAMKLMEAGTNLVVADNADTGETMELLYGPGKAIAVTVDVADFASAAAMAERALTAFGRIDVLVNNAALYGGLKGGRAEQLDEAEWDRCMAVNVKGVWNCCRAVIPAMRKQGGGSIVNVASLAAVYGLPYALHYSTSKAAVIGMTRALARELGRDWIRVNAVAPSAVLTEGTKEFFGTRFEKGMDTVRAGQALKRNLESEDLAGTVLYLAGDASKFVTGQTIMVDGGTHFL